MQNTPANNLTLGVILGLVGLGTAGWFGPTKLAEANASAHWNTVPTTVIETRLASQTRRNHGTDWHVTVVHEYEVDGSTHRGERWDVHGSAGFERREDAERFARGYRTGDAIEAFVDPDDPSSSVLTRGGTGEAWSTIVFGALLVGVGGYLVVKAQRQRAASDDAARDGTARA